MEPNGKASEQRRRERILEAAHRALLSVGYEKITTRKIAEEADVNIATLHYYFGTKEALLSETLRWAAGQIAERLRSAMRPATSAEEAIELAFAEVWQLVGERPGMLRYDVAVRGLRDETAQAITRSIYSNLRLLLCEALERHVAEGGEIAPGVSVESFARYVVAAVDGIILHHLIFDEEEAAQESLRLLMRHARTLLGGL